MFRNYSIYSSDFLDYLAITLMAVQFSFDSCVYLPTIAYWIKEVCIKLVELQTKLTQSAVSSMSYTTCL